MRLFAILGLLFASNLLYAKGFRKVPELACPERIDVESEQELVSTPKDWRKFIDKKNFRPNLHQINFYGDVPESMAQLKPNEHGVVELGPNHWVTCVYSQTHVQLTRKIPAQFKECRSVYKESTPTGVECR